MAAFNLTGQGMQRNAADGLFTKPSMTVSCQMAPSGSWIQKDPGCSSWAYQKKLPQPLRLPHGRMVCEKLPRPEVIIPTFNLDFNLLDFLQEIGKMFYNTFVDLFAFFFAPKKGVPYGCLISVLVMFHGNPDIL